jgi:hypothetical protein
MRRKLALYAMFALFACAYATLDRLPRAAVQTLRGVEHILRGDDPAAAGSSEA